MMRHLSYRLGLLGLVLLILASSITALAASNSVPATRLGRSTRPINANALKPSACAALNLTAIVTCPVGGGNCNGSSVNELILGSPNPDKISGKGGTDCILGGGGDDDINGNGGGDVCIGGPGNDTFKSCGTVIQ